MYWATLLKFSQFEHCILAIWIYIVCTVVVRIGYESTRPWFSCEIFIFVYEYFKLELNFIYLHKDIKEKLDFSSWVSGKYFSWLRNPDQTLLYILIYSRQYKNKTIVNKHNVYLPIILNVHTNSRTFNMYNTFDILWFPCYNFVTLPIGK